LSGSVLNPWAFQRNPKDRVKQLAKFAGCPTDTNKAMVNCLKAAPVGEIGHAQIKFKVTFFRNSFFFIKISSLTE